MEVQNNPILPARPEVLSKAGLDKPAGEYTLREAVNWYKQFLVLGELRGPEEGAVTQTWLVLVGAIAEREGVPTSFLAYLLFQLVTQETTPREASSV